MKLRIAALAMVAVVAVVALAIAGPWQRESEAIGPDINNDGIVDLPNDIMGTIQAFGQIVPTEFSIKARPMRLILEDTVFLTPAGGTTALVDTSECSEFTAMLDPSTGTSARFADSQEPNGNIRTSPNGTRKIEARVSGILSSNFAGGPGGSTFSFSGAYPYLALVVTGDAGDSADIWLFCR